MGIVGFLVAALTAVALITSSAQAHPSRASPPQGKIVFEQFIDDQTGSALWVVNGDGSGLRRLVPPDAQDPSKSPDSRKIAFTTIAYPNALCIVNVAGTGRRCIKAVPAGRATWSPDGRRLAYEPERGDPGHVEDAIAVIGANGGGKRMLTPNALGPSGPDWSPDGRRIAFTGANGAIYVINSGGSGLRKVVAPKSRTNTPGERNVRWSPDGKNLLFNSFRGAWTVNATGGRLARLVSSAGIVESAAWSPDGKEIAYATSGGIHILNLATRRSRSLSQRPLGAVALDW